MKFLNDDFIYYAKQATPTYLAVCEKVLNERDATKKRIKQLTLI